MLKPHDIGNTDIKSPIDNKFPSKRVAITCNGSIHVDVRFGSFTGTALSSLLVSLLLLFLLSYFY